MSRKMVSQFECSRLMLPEHQKLLEERLIKEQNNEERKDIIMPDEKQQEVMGHMLNRSILERKTVVLYLLTETGTVITKGVIKEYIYPPGQILIKTVIGNYNKIDISSVLKVEFPGG